MICSVRNCIENEFSPPPLQAGKFRHDLQDGFFIEIDEPFAADNQVQMVKTGSEVIREI
jgi:hypothetical protein